MIPFYAWLQEGYRVGEVPTWTGSEANALRAAMRLSLRAFAEHLGISFGTVASWNRRGATVTPTPDMQAVLDTALARSSPAVQARFRAATATAGSGGGGPDQADISRSGLPDTRTSGRALTGTDEVLLTVQVNGQPVTLPLEVVADVARTSAGGGVSLTGAVVGLRGPASRGRAVFVGDERAYELFVRGYGLMGANDRREIEMAQALLQRAVNRDPHFARAIGARGYTSWRQYFAGWTTHSQALIDAFRDVDAALEVDPGSVVAHMTFIRACWDMGWHERALEAGRAVHERNPDSLDATVAFARALNNAGLAQYALPLVTSVLADDSTHPAAVKLNVWCHLMVGDHTGTMEVSRDYLARTPGDANTRWAVALAAANLPNLPGGYASAIGIARDGLAADPGDVTLWVLLGYLHRLAGDEAEARQTWAQGADQIGAGGAGVSNPRTRAWLANLLAGVGQVDSVLETVGVLSDAEPNNGYLRYRLAHALAEAGRTDEAVDMLGSAVANGFLSAQLLRQEGLLALARVSGHPGFAGVLRDLDAKVVNCQRMYAADLPVAEPAAGSVRGGEPT